MVHLFADVGQVEVRRERTGQRDRRGGVRGAQQPGRGVRVLSDAEPDLLHEVEEVPALLAGQGLAEQGRQPSNIRPERSVHLGCRVHTQILPQSGAPQGRVTVGRRPVRRALDPDRRRVGDVHLAVGAVLHAQHGRRVGEQRRVTGRTGTGRDRHAMKVFGALGEGPSWLVLVGASGGVLHVAVGPQP